MSESERERGQRRPGPSWAKDERLEDDLESIPEDGQAVSTPYGPDRVRQDDGRRRPSSA